MALLNHSSLAGNRRGSCANGCLLVLLLSMAAQAGATPPPASPIPATASAAQREYQIKAVFLLNFARFVDWPAETFTSETAPFEIGVLGSDPFGAYLDEAVRGETVNRRAVVVRRFRSVADIRSCHVLFICRSEAAHLESIVTSLEGRGILTVGDAENFADHGGMIGFVKHNDKVRLQINLDAAKGSNLTISAKLLRPSEIVGNWKKRQLQLNDPSRHPWGSEAGRQVADPTLRYVRRDVPTIVSRHS